MWIACGVLLTLAGQRLATLLGWDAPAVPPHLTARTCPPGAGCHQTWTLTTRLGDVLDFYAARLGPRNPADRLLGIEFTSEPRPGVRYADFGNGKRNLIIQLTRGAARDPDLALFQLAHEAFHLLEPIAAGSVASTLEEGLASYYAVLYMTSAGIEDGARHISEASYRAAYDQVVRLAGPHQDFDGAIRRLRAAGGSFSTISKDTVLTAFPGTPDALASTLAEPFPGTSGVNR